MRDRGSCVRSAQRDLASFSNGSGITASLDDRHGEQADKMTGMTITSPRTFEASSARLTRLHLRSIFRDPSRAAFRDFRKFKENSILARTMAAQKTRTTEGDTKEATSAVNNPASYDTCVSKSYFGRP